MKLAAQDVALGKTKPQEVLAELSSINRKAEREHNILVATIFNEWWKEQSARGCKPLVERPSGNLQREGMPFKIRMKPELRYDNNGVDTVVYLWATATPRLTNQVAATGIMILQEAFAQTEYADCDYKIFDLRRNRLLGAETISNATATNLTGDIAQIGAIWAQVS